MDVEGFEHHVVKGGMDHFWNTMQVQHHTHIYIYIV